MGAKKSAKSSQSKKEGSQSQHVPDAVEVLKKQHKTLQDTLGSLANFHGSNEQIKALRNICAAWSECNTLKAEVLYPAFRASGVDANAINEALIEADLATLLIADLACRRADDELLPASVGVLLRLLPRVIERDEEASVGLFAVAQKTGFDSKTVGKVLQARMAESEQHAEEFDQLPLPRHLRGAGMARSAKEYEQMRGRERERDERGRFVDDDDYRSSRSQSSRGSSGRSRRDDDDTGDGRGWHGDSRGHAEASRRGWDERRSTRSDYDDDDRRSSSRRRSDEDDDDRRSSGRNHGRGGWFGDSEGHSEASRRGWDNPDHGRSGWFGDREGHSEASRRGWDSPDHGRSGWFGDPEGHSEASRRGWDERRSSRDDDDDYDRRRYRRR